VCKSSELKWFVSGPHDVTVVEKSLDTIHLQWVYGDVAGVTFWVQYRPHDATATTTTTADDDEDKDDKDAETWIRSQETSTTEYTLTDLQPATEYELCVVARNDTGRTQSSSIVSCQTDERPRKTLVQKNLCNSMGYLVV